MEVTGGYSSWDWGALLEVMVVGVLLLLDELSWYKYEPARVEDHILVQVKTGSIERSSQDDEVHARQAVCGLYREAASCYCDEKSLW